MSEALHYLAVAFGCGVTGIIGVRIGWLIYDFIDWEITVAKRWQDLWWWIRDRGS